MSNTKVITGKCRLSYVNIFQPKSINGSDPKYSVSVLINKKDKETLEKIEKAIKAAEELGKASKWGGKIPKNLKRPLRDGDEEREDDEAYRGHYFVNATSLAKPGVVDRDLNEIIDPTEVYSGCYARLSLNFYPFDVNGNRGIACGLNNIQKWADGEPLGGRTRPEDDFETIEDEDDFLS